MKKTYINPEMDVVEIKMNNLIAASAGFGEGGVPCGGATSREDEELDDFLLGGGDITKLLGM
ncbi:MAG: hypothetical protein IJV17_05715 [Prevotella sp.]|nr:hypothetical protein [Prevotella sp.]